MNDPPQGNQRSLPGPLLFNAQYLIRLQFPLGYNFMRILRYYGTDYSNVPPLKLPAFQTLMNDMTAVPVLGTSFNIYVPMVLVVLCVFTFLKVRKAFLCDGVDIGVVLHPWVEQ